MSDMVPTENDMMQAIQSGNMALAMEMANRRAEADRKLAAEEAAAKKLEEQANTQQASMHAPTMPGFPATQFNAMIGVVVALTQVSPIWDNATKQVLIRAILGNASATE